MCFAAAGFLVAVFSLQAQTGEALYRSDYRIAPEQERQLSIEMDNLNFFRNNEYAGRMIKGYTLPGFWAQAKAVYHPLRTVRLEAGFHAFVYHGAYKYPATAYQDIARWKGNQYQTGIRLLPWFRTQAMLSEQVTVVLGNIYGAANHRLPELLYNPELNLTADPETGLQLLLDTRSFEADVWVNWQSFIFQTDTHQEAFTFGLSSRIKFNRPEARFHLYAPFQALIQHRGGEIDTITVRSVQTLTNAAVGIGLQWNVNRGIFKRLNVETGIASYIQQAGDLLPLDKGQGWYAFAIADLYDFRLKASHFRNSDFITLYGLPFYGALSYQEENATYRNPALLTFGLEYFRSLGKGYALGVDANLYYTQPSVMHNPATGTRSEKAAVSLSTSLVLRINPAFLLKRINVK